MQDRMWTASALALGFALGGFFDGVLLHQILQWHHLLSLVPGITDLRQQILWDGYFHAVMYLVALFGLIGLWRGRNQGASGTVLAGRLLVGFGLWHTTDAVLSHWLLGIHRIRVDSAFPLLWDIGWLIFFGLLPLAFGWLLTRRGGGPGGGRWPVLLAGILAFGLGAWALRPPEGMPLTAVVFRAGLGEDQIAAVLEQAGARLVWADLTTGVVLVDMDLRHRLGLYRQGALLVGGSLLPAGCFAWSRA
nr:DUF2243 domain-containing protein [Paracoccus saliphilus]